MAVEVRPARLEDAADLAVVHVRAWQAAYVGLMPQDHLDGLDPDVRAQEWRRRLGEHRDAFGVLVAVVDGHLAGFVAFGPARDAESGTDGELYAINVHPDHWGCGAGSALLVAAEAGLATRGHETAVLWVVPGNARARRFYERHGWTAEDSRREREVQGVTVAEVRYRRAVVAPTRLPRRDT